VLAGQGSLHNRKEKSQRKSSSESFS